MGTPCLQASKPSLVFRASHSLSLRSLPLATPVLRKLLLLFSSPLATIHLPQRSQNNFPLTRSIHFCSIGPQSRKCTYFFSSSSLWICVYIFTHIHPPIFTLQGILSFVRMRTFVFAISLLLPHSVWWIFFFFFFIVGPDPGGVLFCNNHIFFLMG